MNSEIEKILAERIEAWDRKLINIKGGFYVNIPKPIVRASGKRRGSIVRFYRLIDAKTGRVINAFEFKDAERY
ncbi:hypothetical protein KEJ25_10380 [Candidatus Bathyarchaeota archaeon]|nr:hypothetical protein [Candidatus Bathyarchaeota archaeon]